MNMFRPLLLSKIENDKETPFNIAQNNTETDVTNTTEKDPEIHTV